MNKRTRNEGVNGCTDERMDGLRMRRRRGRDNKGATSGDLFAPCITAKINSILFPSTLSTKNLCAVLKEGALTYSSQGWP